MLSRARAALTRAEREIQVHDTIDAAENPVCTY